MRIKLLKDSRKMKWYKRILLQIGKFCFFPISLRKETLKIIAKVKNGGIHNSQYVASILCNDTKLLKRKYFSEYVLVEFEGRKFFAIKDFDDWLKIEYGDYMKLPKESERMSPHTLKGVYWK